MDASSRKQRRRFESQVRFISDLVEHLAEGIALVDREGYLVFVNQSFAKLHGYESRELIGMPLMNLYPSDKVMTVALLDLETENHGECTTELVHVRRDGSPFPVTRSSSLMRDDNGIPIGTVVTVRDISEMKVLESIASKSQAERIRHLEQRLEEISGELEQSRVELRKQAQRLRHADEAFKIMASEIEMCRQDAEKAVFRKVSDTVYPLLDQLNAQKLPPSAKHLLASLAFNLKSLFLPSVLPFEEELAELTPQELRLCELIGSGLTSKQIADATGISPGTVNAHRFNIRKKLGLIGSGRQLTSHLRQKLMHD